MSFFFKEEKNEPKYECSEKIDGVKVYNYFNPPKLEEVDVDKKKAYILIAKGIGGVVLAFVLLGTGLFSTIKVLNMLWLIPLLIGTIVIAVGAFKIQFAKQKKQELLKKVVTDEEYDQMELEMLKDTKLLGMEALNLDEDEIQEAEPIVLHMYRNTSDGVSRRGDDGKYRCSENMTTVFFFTSDSLFVYNRGFSMKDKATTDNTMTVFYKDIVSVETNSAELCLDTEKIAFKSLTISTASGSHKEYRYIDSPKINQSISAMQQLFRNKKREHE